jgi:serine/threonine protein kinase
MQVLLQSEISVLKKLSHDSVLKCQDIFITINNCYIISELCGDGDLASLLKKKGRLRGVEALNVMTGIIDGYLYLQSLDILHRDLKPANIFMNNGQVKIGDFGFSCY